MASESQLRCYPRPILLDSIRCMKKQCFMYAWLSLGCSLCCFQCVACFAPGGVRGFVATSRPSIRMSYHLRPDRVLPYPRRQGACPVVSYVLCSTVPRPSIPFPVGTPIITCAIGRTFQDDYLSVWNLLRHSCSGVAHNVCRVASQGKPVLLGGDCTLVLFSGNLPIPLPCLQTY